LICWISPSFLTLILSLPPMDQLRFLLGVNLILQMR
jgi:hypothetical protein